MSNKQNGKYIIISRPNIAWIRSFCLLKNKNLDITMINFKLQDIVPVSETFKLLKGPSNLDIVVEWVENVKRMKKSWMSTCNSSKWYVI